MGDALGAAVEFMTREQITQRYGRRGITSFDIAYGRAGAITDDTQMTLFTAEGLLRAEVGQHRGAAISRRRRRRTCVGSTLRGMRRRSRCRSGNPDG